MVTQLSIGVVASLLGVHPQTIRDYEALELISPLRTPRGTRRFRDSDIRRIQQIHQLKERGVNLVGIKIILELQSQINELNETIQKLDPEAEQLQTQPSSTTTVLEKRSMSVEIIHIPQQKGPRKWRNR